jgi:hypothetical protein
VQPVESHLAIGRKLLAEGRRTQEFTDMSKRELIERIMQINHSARREFLLGFTENELADYLRQIETLGADAVGVVEPEPVGAGVSVC